MQLTTVKYTKTKAIISMDKNSYKKLCDGYNCLNKACNMLAEVEDLYLSDISNLNQLKYSMAHSLGFEEGEHYWSDSVIPKEK
jgi:uncharacterized cysteine cluster protein YcgN (CxxCxxCC family)